MMVLWLSIQSAWLIEYDMAKAQLVQQACKLLLQTIEQQE